MKSVKFRSLCSLAALILLLGLVAAYAAEHPGAGSGEHPSAGGASAKVTPAQISSAVDNFLKSDAKLHGGYFLYYDAKNKEPLALSLARIHKDKISMLSDDLCFVCADLKTPSGRMYDLDFFVSHPGGRNLRVSEITIHKEAGKPRYNWVKKGDTWVRQ